MVQADVTSGYVEGSMVENEAFLGEKKVRFSLLFFPSIFITPADAATAGSPGPENPSQPNGLKKVP